VGNELKHDEVTLLLSPGGDEMTLQLADQARLKGKATFRRLSRTDLPSMEAEHDTLMRYINRVVLAGVYKDDKSESESETLVYTPDMYYYIDSGDPGKISAKLLYKFEMNIPVDRCDGLYYMAEGEGRHPQYTAFVWRGKTLEFYDTKPDPKNPDGLVREKKPITRLTRIGPPPKVSGATQ
jgi:hypothetical protein